MERITNHKTQFITIVGVMAAMVFVSSFMRIMLTEDTSVHFGNIFCMLSGLLFGPLTGGLASGIGSAIYDLTNPKFSNEFFITFVNKFFMGFLAGLVYSRLKIRPLKGADKYVSAIIAAIIGQVAYIILYILKSYIFEFYLIGNAKEAVIAKLILKAITSSVNGAFSVVCAVALVMALRKVLIKTPLRGNIIRLE